MRQLTLTAGCALAWVSTAGAVTQPQWVNYGEILAPPQLVPQVDATNFINHGTINIRTTPLPFDTSNTRNFTNNGTMIGSVGFRLDTVLTGPGGGGSRRLAANFYNKSGATVTATDTAGRGYLFIHATNLVNRGTLGVGANGWMQLVATNADLYRSGLNGGAIEPRGSVNGSSSFRPDIAITDLYWAQTNMDFNSANILQFQETNIFVVTPPHLINVGGSQRLWSFSLFNPAWGCYTNTISGISLTLTNMDGSTTNVFAPTNIVRQAAFVSVADTNIGVSIRFAPSSRPTNFFQNVAVRTSWLSTNLVTAAPELTSLYFLDTLAAEPERGLLVNQDTGNTFRPANYLLSRSNTFGFNGFSAGNAVLTTNFLYDENFTNRVVAGPYAAYGAFVDNIITRPPLIVGGDVTNLPGRVEIRAENLNMERTRVRAEGFVSIQTKHLASSSNAVVDSENLLFNLASTNGQLTVRHLARETVARFKGDLYAWSAVWQNQWIQIYTNYIIDPTNPEPAIQLVTNLVNVGLHTLVLSGDLLLTQLPVLTHDLNLRSTNILVGDNITAVRSFIADGQSLTLEGSLTLSNVLADWRATNAPGVIFFTNSGTLNVPNEMHLGDDRPARYESVVNRGTINAAGQNYRSGYFENNGILDAAGPVTIEADDAKLDGGQLLAGSDVQLSGGVLRMRQHSISAPNGRLYLDIATNLSDTGGGAGNTIVVGDGFRLLRKPATGDLLGTRLQSAAAPFAEAEHYWAAENLGAIPAGFSNNAAVGRLALSVGVEGLLIFRGTGPNKALYVDYLELDSYLAANLDASLNIDPGFKIYFADANVVADDLDGRLGGRLVWVKNYAGPNSSVQVMLPNGAIIWVNRALRQSTRIDSDADGLANGYDITPFSPVPLRGVTVVRTSTPPRAFISWRAAAQTVYCLEYRTNVVAAAWQPLAVFTNTASTNGMVTVADPHPVGPGPRYYRLYYTP